MKKAIEEIYDTIKDYRNDDGIYITQDHIQKWANQFGDNKEFVLKEFAHIVKQVYISKTKGYKYLEAVLLFLQKKYKSKDLSSLLRDTLFLQLQPKGKSQRVLIGMLDELVLAKEGHHLSEYDNYPKCHYIYIDDVLASGKTMGDDLVEWISEDDHCNKIKNKQIDLKVLLICRHSLGLSLQLFRISQQLDIEAKLIDVKSLYTIENNTKDYEPKLNIALPIKNYLSHEAIQYFDALQADDKYSKYGFRNEGSPHEETFFSSAENRIKYENILIDKGLEILKDTKNIGSYTRPLGLVNPKYKTLGMGTHFFTWRNVPNNCPIVFWWETQGSNWIPLFTKKQNAPWWKLDLTTLLNP